ncbi:hypothetical protein C8K30_11585 [Promicromonospora sp. AC04]|uniref:hypothetical protein n=1 Tax=Promicromonospora sp. AC04 TaxID=2135723 RepID=UPI000D3974A5|nr:hypothetical protein [Promicromonospora sp. AC04]PUB20874.1 hypothetical protein C8K30_11585 [Promicromonospora sp. AC04]
MSTTTSPQHDAEDAAEALRRLSHSTRTFADLSDTYWVLNDLAAMVRRLEQVTTQVAAAHSDNAHLAHDHHGQAAAGHVQALTAAGHLRKVVQLVGLAHVSLDLALSHSGAIAWYDPTSTTLTATGASTALTVERPGGRTRQVGDGSRPAGEAGGQPR